MSQQVDVSYLLKKTGFCPYCGNELIPVAYDTNTGWLEWANCKRELCHGTLVTVTTDAFGFILSPRSKEGLYIYKRPSLSGRHNATRRLR